MNIFGPPTVSFERIRDNLSKRTPTPARFILEMLRPLWISAVTHNIDPVVMIAQAAHETAYGEYTGKVPHWFYNTCGLKIRNITQFSEASGDQPLAHAQFASWEAGTTAHAQHLLAYGGRALNPGEALLDPRWVWVAGKHKVTQVEELSGKWAPAANYGILVKEKALLLSK